MDRIAGSLLLATVLCMAPPCRGLQSAEDGGAAFREENGAKVAVKPAVVVIPLTANTNAIGLSVTPGNKPHTQMVLEFAGGGKRALTLSVQAQSFRREHQFLGAADGIARVGRKQTSGRRCDQQAARQGQQQVAHRILLRECHSL